MVTADNGTVETLTGVVENVVYHNEQNDYTVLELVDGESALVTAVGSIPMVFEGENLSLRGQWVYHKEFGRQFAFESFEKSLPQEVDGILQYLSSRTVRGVGPVTALKIVNRFGTDTFEVIENHPEWLADIPGITMKKAADISAAFREQSGIRGVMMFCKDYMGSGEVTRVYKRFGSGAVGIIQENPYILCNGECGIPFDRVDRMAASLGFPRDDPNRIESALIYVLDFNARGNGHTCLPEGKLAEATAALLELPEERVRAVMAEAVSEKTLCTLKDGDTLYVMTAEVAEAEEYIAQRLCELNRSAGTLSVTDISSLVEKAEQESGIRYADMQRRALYEAFRTGTMILTGGPGTGKTTVVKALLSIFRSLGMKTVLVAPTGRAAKRLSEATCEEAKTLHRMLEMERVPETEHIRFNRNAQNPLNEQVVIVDEASMIDLSLMNALMHAMRRGSRLILIGDSNQLPSVGAGNVLADLIQSEKLNLITLVEIFRQAQESLIVTNAHRIHSGQMPLLHVTDSDFFFMRRENERTIPGTIVSLLTERLPRTYGQDIREAIQVITPSKKGVGGVEVLNRELQEKLNPPKPFKKEKASHGVVFREGDRVMQTANNYEIPWTRDGMEGMGIFNGDIGTVESINPKESTMRIRFDDRVCEYEFSMMEDLDLAYAITVHKSQGSEYPVVIIPVYSCPPMLCTRNLLYTAVTRARRMVILVGRPDILGRMVENNREILRYTTLRHRIAREF